MNDDLIRRSDALKAVDNRNEELLNHAEYRKKHCDIDLLGIKKHILAIPPIKKNAEDWIPIKMRPGTDEEYEKFCKYGDCPREDFRVFECPVPDDGQEVLITTLWGDVCIDTWHQEIDCSWFEDHEDIDDVIAWMPKPEGYKAEVKE